MNEKHTTPDQAFTLDRQRFQQELTKDRPVAEWLDPFHEPGGLTGAIRSRLYDALDAGAISGPEGFEIFAYAVGEGDLVVCLKGRRSIRVTDLPIESRHLRSEGEPDFEECCEIIEYILREASSLIPAARLLDQADAINPQGEVTLLELAALELLRDGLQERLDEQGEQPALSEPQREELLCQLARQLASTLRSATSAFIAELPPIQPANQGQ